MRSVPSLPLVGPFAERLFAMDLPDLPSDRRERTIRFTARRIDGLPSVMRIGVIAIAALLRVLLALPASHRVVAFVGRRPLPVIGEYVRLIRSLGYAFVWETWPDTRPSGAAA